MNTIEKGNQVAPYQAATIDLPVPDTSSAALILNGDAMDRVMRLAKIMASGKSTIPAHLRGNEGDCAAIIMQAMRWGMDPFAVASKTHLSQSGALGYEAQLVSAVVTAIAPIKGRPEYEFLGDWNQVLGKVEERKSEKGGKYYVATYTKKDEEGLGVIVRATFIGEEKPREIEVMMSQAYPRFSTQWATDPRQQIGYLAIRKWARRYTPDVLLGVYTPEELQEVQPRDMGRVEVVREMPSDDLVKASQDAASRGVAAYQQFWTETGKPNRTLLVDYHEENKRTAQDVDRAAEEKAEKAASRAAAKAPKQEAQAAPPADQGAPEVTAKMVFDCLTAAFDARDVDELNTAADMIRNVEDEKQRKALTDEYNSMLATIEGGAQ